MSEVICSIGIEYIKPMRIKTQRGKADIYEDKIIEINPLSDYTFETGKQKV